MASQRASITKELLRESLESVLKPFKIHSLDGKFSCVLEFLMGRKVFVNQPTGSGMQLVTSVKYQTLLSCPFSQGAMRRVRIIRLHLT